MQIFSEQKAINAINAGEPFECLLEGGGLEIRIKEYAPYICTAIHAGNNLRPDLEKKCLLTKEERQREEDPLTEILIEGFPVTLINRDSRYEYDLNRAPEQCIYDVAWEQKVWKSPITKRQREVTLEKHALYYRILDALINRLNKQFSGCLIIDMHSYNWQIRNLETSPIFNIGTAQFNLDKWEKLLETIEQELNKIQLPNIETTVGRDIVFQGRGYQATFAASHKYCPPLIPFEVKKVFMDEKTGHSYPLVLESLQQGIYQAILKTVEKYVECKGHPKIKSAPLIASEIDPQALKVDKALFQLVQGTDTLHYANPTNALLERRYFLSRNAYEPAFRYKQLKIDPYLFRDKLYRLPVSKIRDPLLREMYRIVIDGYAKKIDLITSVGNPQFLYNSLRQYGKPTPNDIANAHFILHAATIHKEEIEPKDVTPEAAKLAFEKVIKEYDIDFKVNISKRIVAKAMVDNSRKVVHLNEEIRLTQTELQSLIHHEFGVHVLTTMNALEQPLKVLRLGLPGNTYTQEGLAILSEFMSGNLTLQRLRTLAMRVLAVNMMSEGRQFRTVFNYLKEVHQCTPEESFNITTRVFRGGGFTKDHLYLCGFRDMLQLHQKCDIKLLFIGKTSSSFLETIEQLVKRGSLKPPKYLPPFFTKDKASHAILDYLVQGIK